MERLPQIEFTRQEALQLWLKRRGLTLEEMATAMNTGKNSVSRLLRAETIPSRRHRQLRGLGIPLELLPPAEDITPGPKRAIRLPPAQAQAG